MLYSIYIAKQEPCPHCQRGTRTVWQPVRPTHGTPYEWTREEAERQRASLYPEVYEGIKIDTAGKGKHSSDSHNPLSLH